ncbi:MAG: hypothetical protein K1X75_08665 [Leptospirales bacterium]|nr:hypothetical protein [Leptospirales bacterium]
MGENILQWPVFSWAFAAPGLIFIFILLVIVFISRLRYLKEGQRKALWLSLAKFAVKRKLTPGELSLLKHFYDHLTEEEQDEAMHSKRKLHARLHDYLAHHSQIPARERVQMMDKLFPEIDFHMEVKSINDVQLGELCSAEFEEHRMLGAIVKKSDGALFVSLPDWRPHHDYAGVAARLYFFRLNIGGFLMDGSLQRASPGGVVFEPSGAVEFLGERHLMMQISIPALFTAWSVEAHGPVQVAAPPQESGSAASAAGADATAAPPAASLPLQFQGVTDRVSDRALVFVINRPSSAIEQLLHRYEVWEGDLELPGGFRLRCLGKITRAPGPDRFLFRYLNLSEAARNVLWQTIQTHNPEREKLL